MSDKPSAEFMERQANNGSVFGISLINEPSKYHGEHYAQVPMTSLPRQRRVGILQLARLGSTRLPRKLLQELHGETLLTRGCRFLATIRDYYGVPAVIATPKNDTQIRDAAAAFGIDVIDQPERAANWNELSAGMADELLRFDFVWDANLFCMPFVGLPTAGRMLDLCRTTPVPFTTAARRRNVLWHSDGVPMLSAGQLQNTTENDAYLECTTFGYGFNPNILRLPETEQAKLVKPVAFRLHPLEQIDIDTEEDLELARSLPNERHNSRKFDETINTRKEHADV